MPHRLLRYRMPTGVVETYDESHPLNVETYDALKARLPLVKAVIEAEWSEPDLADVLSLPQVVKRIEAMELDLADVKKKVK